MFINMMHHLIGSRDSSMAVWTVPHHSYDDMYLAENVPSLEPFHIFNNIDSPCPSDKVRDLAVHKDRQVRM